MIEAIFEILDHLLELIKSIKKKKHKEKNHKES